MATAVEQIAVPLADSVRKAIAGITSY
jgi:hypothetical protein